MIAEMLQIPSISVAQGVSVEDGKVVVKKLRKSGYEIIRSSIPALITASNEIGDLRLPSLQAIKEVKTKPVATWNISDLEIDPHRLTKSPLRALVIPPSRARTCLFIEGESPEGKGEKLALQLRHDKVL